MSHRLLIHESGKDARVVRGPRFVDVVYEGMETVTDMVFREMDR
jgi:hypothetical protein